MVKYKKQQGGIHMMEDYTFIDFDGVILDTQDRLFERKSNLGLYNHYDQREYEKYFEYTMLHPEEWDYIIREAKSINHSVEIIRELESMKKRMTHTLVSFTSKPSRERPLLRLQYESNCCPDKEPSPFCFPSWKRIITVSATHIAINKKIRTIFNACIIASHLG